MSHGYVARARVCVCVVVVDAVVVVVLLLQRHRVMNRRMQQEEGRWQRGCSACEARGCTSLFAARQTVGSCATISELWG
jgi:hypothetical protein